MPSNQPADWYPDPADASRYRYWDGPVVDRALCTSHDPAVAAAPVGGQKPEVDHRRDVGHARHCVGAGSGHLVRLSCRR